MKKMRHHSKTLNRILIGYLFITLSIATFISIETNVSAETELYSADSYVTMEINYAIYYRPLYHNPSLLKIWIARLNNWSFVQSSNLTEFIMPQDYSNYTYDPSDVYNNSYDFFEQGYEGFGDSTEFLANYTYILRLTSREWEIPSNLTINDYDKESDLYRFYTSPQPLCESDDPLIINKTKELVGDETSINEIIRSIYYFVITNMTYKLQQKAMGAKMALETLTGDCSEYSSLMVALLRAAGIPARKVLGLGIVEGEISQAQPRFNLQVNDKWNYTMSLSENTFPGHAWVQYYVPGLGWVSADPTWGASIYNTSKTLSDEYLNKIDYLHLITTVGGWYGEGIEPPLQFVEDNVTGIGEFPYLYPIVTSQYFDFKTTISFRVIETHYEPLETPDISMTTVLVMLLATGTPIIIFVALAFAIKRRKQRRREKHTPYRYRKY